MARGQHGRGRSIPDRQMLRRIVREQDYEPTVQEESPFDDSTATGENLAPSSPTRRPIPLHRRFQNHITEHWFGWLCSVIAAIVVGAAGVFSWFTHEARLHFATLDNDAKESSAKLGEMKTDLKAAQGAIQEVKSQNQELRARMDQTQTLVNLLVGNRLQPSDSGHPPPDPKPAAK